MKRLDANFVSRKRVLSVLTGCAAHDTQLARFTREGRTASKIKSSHVTRVFDVGRTEDGLPFFVMELLEGQDFAELIRARRPLPTARAVDYVLEACEACEAIAEAHAIGIVHHDCYRNDQCASNQCANGDCAP